MAMKTRPVFDQYIKISKNCIANGEMVFNERTKKSCLTIANQHMTYDVENNVLPLDTTRKSFWKAAVAELLGHMRGYDNAEDYAKLGARTWYKDANECVQWLENPNRKGENDCGIIYGGIANNIPFLRYDDNNTGNLVQSGSFNTLAKIYKDLKAGKDDRGEIWNFWQPSLFHLGCIRPCMYSHHFTLINGKLWLESTSRSGDGSLGINFNSVQAFALLAIMAQITGNKAMEVKHNITNFHIYEPHIENFKEQMEREPFPAPTFHINPEIKTLEDVLTWVTPDDFWIEGYEHHDAVDYEMFTGA